MRRKKDYRTTSDMTHYARRFVLIALVVLAVVVLIAVVLVMR